MKDRDGRRVADAVWSVYPANGGGYAVRFQSSLLNRRHGWAGAEEFDKLRDSSTGVRAGLENTLGGRIPLEPKSAAWDQCQEILDETKGLLSMYSGGKPDVIRQDLTDLIRAAGGRVPVLEIQAPFEPPLDVAPVFTSNEDHFLGVGRRGSIGEAARGCFLGLSVATRVVGVDANARSLPVDRELLRSSSSLSGSVGVDVAPFFNAHLKGVKDHLDRLAAIKPFRMAALLPDGDTPDRRWLARRLISSRDSGCVHIAAHCDIRKDLPNEDSLVFSHRGLKRNLFPVPIKLLEPMGNDRRLTGVPDGPLAVLVACAADSDRLGAPVSFPSVFEKAGFRCVVAPMATVRVEPAFALAEIMYERIGHGDTVADALVASRNAMLDSFGCPIGLIFRAHGDSYLRGPQ